MRNKLFFLAILLLFSGTDYSFCQLQKSNSQSWNWALAAIPMGNDKVEGILIDPGDENVWYVSSIDSGLYITRDAGATWEHPLQGRGLDQEGFQIDPANPNIIYVTVWDKLYRSGDKGRNWQFLYTCPEYIRSLLVSRTDHAIYLGPQTDNNNTPGIYKSTDGGASFKHQPFGVSTHNLICWDIEEDPVNDILYVPIEIADHPQPYHPPFFRSMDGGKTWQNMSGTLNWHALKVQVDSSSSAVYYQVEGGALYRSANFGQDWQLLHSTFFLSFLVDQQNPNRLFGGRPASTTGGAYLSLDSGHSFFEIGLTGLSVTSVALNASNTQIYAVAYNSGVWKGHIPEDLGSGVLTVTNTSDSGANTLREAITSANRNPDPDSIRFAIPKSDPGYEPQTGGWRIRVLNALPDITDAGLVIDGSSQNEFTGEDSNPAGPEIIIDGSAAGDFTIAFNILTSDVEIRQLCINSFGDRGIFMFGENTRGNTITGCYIGTDATGKTAKPNATGIFIQGTAANTITGNLISGNHAYGIYIMGAAAQNNVILGNLIGTDISGTVALGNGRVGISINCDNNIIGGSSEGERNIVSGNGNDGIEVSGDGNIIKGNYIGSGISATGMLGNKWNGIMFWSGNGNIIGGQEPGESNIITSNTYSGISVGPASGTQIIGNYIGTDFSGTHNMGNDLQGIELFDGANNTNVGPGNVIAFNNIGIQVYGDSSLQNTITQNSITANDGYGIENESGGNESLPSPVIIEIKNGIVTGTAPPGSIVEIFSDNNDEGKIYEGMTMADGSGNFQWNGTPTGPFVTATATDTAGNTSEFSQPMNVTSVAETTESIIPKEFSLSQNYPNPFNPVTKIRFALPARSKVTLKVYNLLGEAVLTLIDGDIPAGIHTLVFDGEQLSSGIYFYRLQATNAQNARTFTQTCKLTLLK